ncbi:MAG: SseB family protein [Clostridiales bacterium]|nr:SseB family protein [Candidatus Blautia equi]
MAKDEGLMGNEKIEEAIAAFLKESNEENLAVALTAIRRRMKEGGQLVVAVDPSPVSNVQIRMMELPDGRKWVPVFTSFEEQMAGKDKVMSTFLADMGQLFDMVLQEPSVSGILLNPWNLKLAMNKQVLQIVKGE